VKAQPDRLRIGSAGNGSGTHFSGELLRLAAGLKMIHVPYKGGGAMLTDLVAGHIESAMATPAIVLPFVKQGRLKILAQGLSKRSAFMPDVPTFVESGYPDVLVSNWYGVMSVGGTPQPVIRRLHAELHKAIAAPDMKDKFASAVLEANPSSPEEFGRRIVAEVDRWKRVVRDTGIHPE
jgi:tripartite-type tricarboxylate transporter receptor subunit TctC